MMESDQNVLKDSAKKNVQHANIQMMQHNVIYALMDIMIQFKTLQRQLLVLHAILPAFHAKEIPPTTVLLVLINTLMHCKPLMLKDHVMLVIQNAVDVLERQINV